MLRKTLKKYLPFAFLFAAQEALAHGAHEHGFAKIDIGVEDTIATIHLEVPAISVYGFEHEAKSDKDKKIISDSMATMKANIHKMVKLDSSLGCTFTITKIDPFVKDNEEEDVEENNEKSKKIKGEHGDFYADFSAKCAKKISGTKVTFGFQKYFPHIHKINAQGLSDKSQAAVKILDDKGFLQL